VHDAWCEPFVTKKIAHPPMMEFLAKNIGIRRANGKVQDCGVVVVCLLLLFFT
jgi:hypothetical protein